MKTIKVKIKYNYGIPTVYPDCDNSRIFCKIAGTITLNALTITHIISLGYELEVIQDDTLPAFLQLQAD